MISKILSGLLSFVIGLSSIITKPIDLLIESSMPDLSEILGTIVNFFDIVSSSIGWGMSLVAFPRDALVIISAFFVFKYAIVGVSSGVKKVVKLWYVLKP